MAQMYNVWIMRDGRLVHSTYLVETAAGETVMSGWSGGVMPRAFRDAVKRAAIDARTGGIVEVDFDGQTYTLDIMDLGDLRVEIDGYVATLYLDGERVGQWQAGFREYEAAGVEWPGCSCGEEPCRHGFVHYWGETLSLAEMIALADGHNVRSFAGANAPAK